MRKSIIVLSALLALQLALAVGLNMGRDQYRAFEPEEKLLTLDTGDVSCFGAFYRAVVQLHPGHTPVCPSVHRGAFLVRGGGCLCNLDLHVLHEPALSDPHGSGTRLRCCPAKDRIE